MGLTEKLAGQHVYFDTNVFIYAFEAAARYRTQLASIADLLDDQESVVVTSEFTLSEILTKPFRDNMLEAVANYRHMLEDSTIRLAPVTRSVLIRSAMLRGQLGIKTPDAVHVATAVDSGCSAFLTNDAAIRLPKSIALVLFSDV
jgi:predicted nucleic acid-binding protein